MRGAGAGSTTVSGNNAVRVFNIGSGKVTLDGMSIVNGNATGFDGFDGFGPFGNGSSGDIGIGGGIYNRGGRLTVSNSTLSGNSSNGGNGGIGFDGIGFDGIGIGGGIYNEGGIIFSGGIIFGGIIFGGDTTMSNTIVSGNTAPRGREIWNSATFTSQGYNLFGYSGDSGLVDVITASTDITPVAALSTLLAPLGDYGGPTKTHALLPGSAAINAGNTASILDQHGKARVGTADIGAFESQGFTLTATAGTPQNIVVGQAGTTPLTVKVTANDAIEPVAGGVVSVSFAAPTATLAAPATSTLSATNVTIDSSENASTIATANTKSGTYTVKASAIGIKGTADFALTNKADSPTQILPTNTDQNAIVGKSFRALQVKVLDQYGNPVVNNSVTLTLPM